jgi:predicted transporter
VGTPFIQYLPKKHLLGDGWPGDKYSLARFPRENSVLEPVLAVLGLIFLFGAIISGLVLPFATSKDTGARMVPVGDIPMLIFLAVVTLIFMSFTLAASSRLENPRSDLAGMRGTIRRR